MAKRNELMLFTIGWVIAGVVAFLLLLTGLWFLFGRPAFSDGELSPRDSIELVKLALAVIAGVGGIVALVVAYRRQKVNEAAHELAERAQQLNEQEHALSKRAQELKEKEHQLVELDQKRQDTKLFNERFRDASGQLGSEQAAVRLAGVYAMASLADDWKDGRQQCIDVLCAYLRMPYTPPVADPADDRAREREGIDDPKVWRGLQQKRAQERQVRHTVIRVIADHLRLVPANSRSWQGYKFDFTAAVFDGGDFSEVSIDRDTVILFNKALFAGGEVNFRGAVFSGGKVDFGKAVFAAGVVNFRSASFTGGEVDFSNARFSGGRVNFHYVNFIAGNVHFRAAVFSGGEVSFYVQRYRVATSTSLLQSSQVELSPSTVPRCSAARLAFIRRRYLAMVS